MSTETRLLLISNAITRASEALRLGRVGSAKHILADAQSLVARELQDRQPERKAS